MKIDIESMPVRILEKVPVCSWKKIRGGSETVEVYSMNRPSGNVLEMKTDKGRTIRYSCGGPRCVVPVNVVLPEGGTGLVGISGRGRRSRSSSGS
jgi:hypothetical protein